MGGFAQRGCKVVERKSVYEIPDYEDFLPPALLKRAQEEMTEVREVPGLQVEPSLLKKFPRIETPEALSFVCAVYERVKEDLDRVLKQRKMDRAFIDAQTKIAARFNRENRVDYHSPNYRTVVGLTDESNRIVVGPLPETDSYRRQVVESISESAVFVPEYLSGNHVTLFGPPDTRKMSINAMNAWHRKLPHEPPLVDELLRGSDQFPKWGADSEDSKTPIGENLLSAVDNLVECFNQTIHFRDPRTGKDYTLSNENQAQPIKRFAGLALPDGGHVLNGSPLPLHLYEFTMHLFHHWKNEKALSFYVPKLENEEEARYLKKMIETAEQILSEKHSDFIGGQVRLFLVFESPRSIFRIQEMAYELRPYFVGGSLGWHDFLASTARLFRNDPNYRIPVKADPNIVINHIRESHAILEKTLGPFGAIKIGGMYGVLYEDGNDASFQVSIAGFIKDVVIQLRRGLDGFWVAHPNFVRLGFALVEAWRRFERDSSDRSLETLVKAWVQDPKEQEALLSFMNSDDVPGLSQTDPLYLRGVLAADIRESDFIKNSDPEEVRYNIFQALQYLADWLCGNGCVALPATLKSASGQEVFVRVMDDLATTERSRWEVWAEVIHGRVSREKFEAILEEEIQFIRENRKTETKRVQVQWRGEAEKWYPVAIQILREIMTDPNPPEFVTERLLPYTLPFVRQAEKPQKLVE